MSGMLLDVLPYNKILNIQDVPELKGQFVYVMNDYEDDGFSVVIYKDDGNIKFSFGDFNGNKLNPINNKCKNLEYIDKFLAGPLRKMSSLLVVTGVKSMQAYVSISNEEMILIDIRTHYDKYVGPGMLRDVFGKCDIKIPSYVETGCYLTDDKIKELKKSPKKHIVKPSSFKMIARDDDVQPMYARI